MAISRQLYGPEKRLANIGSYTLKEVNPIPPSVASVDLATFKDFLNSQSRYIKAINSGNVVPNTIIVYVAYISSIYNCRVVLNTGGIGTELLGVTNADHNTVVSTVRNSTGISLNPTFGGSLQSTNIVLDEITYAYDAQTVSKFYGSVNGETELANKVYGSVNETVLSGVTGTVRAGSSGISAGIAFDGEVFYNYVKNIIDLTKIPDYLLMHVGRFGETYTLTLYYSDGTFYAFENGSDQINPNLYGITWTEEPQYTGNDYIDLTPVYATNSVAKLIHQGFGHLNYS